MTETIYKNFRNKVGKDNSRSSVAPLLPKGETTPASSSVMDITKIESPKCDNEKEGTCNAKENNVEKDARSTTILTSTPYGNPNKRPEPLKRKSISTESPTVYVEIETSPSPWKIKTRDKSRKESVGNTSLCTVLSGNETYKETGVEDTESEIGDWCHLRPLREAIAISMSAFYGIFIIVLGIVVPIAETFAGKRNPDVFELYYIYLYGFSILFLLFTSRNRLLCRNKSTTCGRRISTLCSVRSRRSYSVSDADDKPTSNNTTYQGANLYLRIGAMVFGIGSMVQSGLHFGQYFQVFDGDKLCHHIALAIKPFMHLLFTFIQLYFIFMCSKVNIDKYKTTTRFGLIHMCGTNMCIWFRVIVVQSINVLRNPAIVESLLATVTPPVTRTTMSSFGKENVSHFHGRKLKMIINETSYSQSELFLPEISCYWYNVMGNLMKSADPFLYPCMIQYSIVCTGILYNMWKKLVHITKTKDRKLSTVSLPSGTTMTTAKGNDDDNDSMDQTSKSGIDCSKSSRGLFLGILISVGAIITMITFHVLSSRRPMDGKAIILTHLSETALYLIMTLAVILAAERMKTLGFKRFSSTGIENTLLLVSFTGLLTFAMFSVLSALFETDKPHGVLTILTNLFMIVQASLQTVFLLAGANMVVKNKEQERKKNGRELIIFLIMCNFSMWAMNTFETQRPEHNPLQLKFYKTLAWSIITYITVPLGLYYRFHSALLLCNIWKNTWKSKLS